MNWKKVTSSKLGQIGVAFVVGAATCWFIYPTKTIEERVKESITTQYEEKLKEVEKQNISIIERLEVENEKLIISMKEEHRVETQSLSSRVLRLQEENRSLKSSSSVEWVKITKPDGTIEERRVSKREMEELSSTIQKVQAESETRIREEVAKVEASKTQEIEKVKKDLQAEISIAKTTIEEKESLIKSLKEKSTSITINPKRFFISAGIDTDLTYSGGVAYQFFGPLMVGLRVDMTKTFSIPRVAVSLGVMF